MRFLCTLVGLSLALTGAAQASELRVATLSSVEDVSLPFWCDWSYDWEARCYREDGPRLAVGGEPDKVWRSALRFSTASLPAGANVVGAELSLWYDRTCIAPRKTSGPCGGRGFELGVHEIFTPRWFSEREVEIGPQVTTAGFDAFAPSQWLFWDLSDLVAGWASGDVANNGVLLKLVDTQEDFGVSGPLFPSSRYSDASLGPRLTVWYLPG
jgi:hypothetical protein